MEANTPISRRTVLGGLGVGTLAATAGCSWILGGDPVTVRWSLEMVGDPEPITDENEFELDHESYFSDGFEVLETGEIAWEVEVLEGPDVNVFIVDAENRQALDDGDDFRAVEGSIDLGVSYIQRPGLELEPAEYALVIYNGDDEPENA